MARIVAFIPDAVGQDDAQHTNAWVGTLVCETLRELGHVPERLTGPPARRATLEAALHEGPDGLAAWCHGADDRGQATSRAALLDQDGGRVLDTDNLSLLAGRWVYAQACESANHLAGEAIWRGATAFAGYTPRIKMAWTPDDILTSDDASSSILPALAAFFATVPQLLAEGRRSEEEIRREVSRMAEPLWEWCDAHDGGSGLEITLQLMTGAYLVVRTPDPA